MRVLPALFCATAFCQAQVELEITGSLKVAGRPADLTIKTPREFSGLITFFTSDNRCSLNDVVTYVATTDEGKKTLKGAVQFFKEGSQTISCASALGTFHKAVTVEATHVTSLAMLSPIGSIRIPSKFMIEMQLAAKNGTGIEANVEISVKSEMQLFASPKRLYTDSHGKVKFELMISQFCAGPKTLTFFVDTNGDGTLQPGEPRLEVPIEVLPNSLPLEVLDGVRRELLALLASGVLAKDPAQVVEHAVERLESMISTATQNFTGKFSQLAEKVREIQDDLTEVPFTVLIRQQLEKAANDIGRIPDLKSFNGGFPGEKNGTGFVVVGFRDALVCTFNGEGGKLLNNKTFPPFAAPVLFSITDLAGSGLASTEILSKDDNMYFLDCLGEGTTPLQYQVRFTLAADQVFEDLRAFREPLEFQVLPTVRLMQQKPREVVIDFICPKADAFWKSFVDFLNDPTTTGPAADFQSKANAATNRREKERYREKAQQYRDLIKETVDILKAKAGKAKFEATDKDKIMDILHDTFVEKLNKFLAKKDSNGRERFGVKFKKGRMEQNDKVPSGPVDTGEFTEKDAINFGKPGSYKYTDNTLDTIKELGNDRGDEKITILCVDLKGIGHIGTAFASTMATINGHKLGQKEGIMYDVYHMTLLPALNKRDDELRKKKGQGLQKEDKCKMLIPAHEVVHLAGLPDALYDDATAVKLKPKVDKGVQICNEIDGTDHGATDDIRKDYDKRHLNSYHPECDQVLSPANEAKVRKYFEEKIK